VLRRSSEKETAAVKRPPLAARYVAQITTILSEALRSKKCTVYLFGSRATGSATGASDFDLAVESLENLSEELSLARDLLDGSNIPFTVDIVDLGTTSEQFARQVRETGIHLWKN